VSRENIPKSDIEGIRIVLPYTQHLQYIFINFYKFTFKAHLICILRWVKEFFLEKGE